MSLLSPTFPGARWRPFNGAAYRYIGADLLDWSDREQDEAQRALMLRTYIPGLVITRGMNGDIGPEWTVTEDGSNAGELLFGASGDGTMAFIDPSGYVVLWAGGTRPCQPFPPKSTGLAVLDDGVWRTVVVRKYLTTYEPGTITFTSGSTTITGTGTRFTNYAGRTTNFGSTSPQVPGTRIRVDTADNAPLAAVASGYYEFATIASDTSATLVTAPGTTATVPFSVVGSFFGTVATASQRDAHQLLVPQFELVTQTREPAVTDLVLADVMRSGGVMTIIDRRPQNIALPQVQAYPQVPHPIFHTTVPTSAATPWTDLALWRSGTGTTTTVETGALVACRSTTGKTLVATSTATDIDIVEFSEINEVGTTIANNVVSGMAGTTRPSLVYVATGASTAKHLLFYQSPAPATPPSKLYMKSSTDGGTTWSAATLILDPTTIDAADHVSQHYAIQLKSGRVVVYFAYYDDSAATNYIRAIYSDDYGTTWNTNSNAGTTIFSGSDAVGNMFAASQDPTSGRVWLFHGDSGVNMRVSQSSNTTGLGTFTRSAALTEKTNHVSYRGGIWASPTGHALVFYESLNNVANTVDLYFAVFGKASGSEVPQQMHVQYIKRLDSHASLDFDNIGEVSVVQTRPGPLAIWHIRSDKTNTLDYFEVIRASVPALPYNMGSSTLT